MNIKIGAKLFLNNDYGDNLLNAVNTIFETLDINYLDNLILAFHPKSSIEVKQQNGGGNDIREGIIDWASADSRAVDNLLKLWNKLEQFAIDKKVYRIVEN